MLIASSFETICYPQIQRCIVVPWFINCKNQYYARVVGGFGVSVDVLWIGTAQPGKGLVEYAPVVTRFVLPLDKSPDMATSSSARMQHYE